MPATPRRTRWTLGVTGGLFVAAVVFSLLTASATQPLLRALLYAGAQLTGHQVLSEDLKQARAEQQPVLAARLDHAREALGAAGWRFGPAADPRFECWTEGDVEVCALFADTEGDALVPPRAEQQLVEIERLLVATAAALGDGGWRCDRPLTPVTAGRGVSATCLAGGTQLELDVRARILGDDVAVTGAGPQVSVRLDVSREAYRSGGAGDGGTI